tara:strand:- start:1346 stop:1756 length:411 start_codon:yes stop_codon:yes gene_type:complete
MAVQQILGKQITKFDTEKLSKNPNFVQEEKPKIKEEVVHGNTIENSSKKVYQGDIKPSQNIYGEEMKDMMTTMMGKLDNIKVQNGNINVDNSIEVDVKRNVFLSKADDASVKIDNVKTGKVNNKVNKLRALRKNGS